jgi:thioredoxin-related protein
MVLNVIKGMYKFVFIFVLFLFSCKTQVTETPQIQWISWETLDEKMKHEPKKIFIDVYTDWCIQCKRMDKKTFTNPDVVKYINKNFYALKFNAESLDTLYFKGEMFINPNPTKKYSLHNLTNEIAKQNNMVAFPTMVFMDEQYRYLMKKASFLEVNDFLLDAKYFGDNIYLSQPYQKYIDEQSVPTYDYPRF